MAEVKNILMVCLGNICRSPVAEGIMRSKVNKYNLSIQIDSAGTSGYHIGENPDQRSIKNARKNGIDISQLIARQLTLSNQSEQQRLPEVQEHQLACSPGGLAVMTATTNRAVRSAVFR
jgi:protein-tyrosine-phosphatase